MTKYEPVIGLEVHVELNTKSKMFCHCSADYFGKKPNTHTCSVCLGLPGALPYTNEVAIESCIRIGLALNCQINEASLFERKNYFYPDLSKGYQISQYRWPLAVYGYMDVVGRDNQTKRIRINRAHQEEDTGKLTHRADLTLVDFNRSGVPLVEIVTEPDFTDSEQVKDYAKKLQQIIKTIGVSNADMEKGDMRLEANVSVRPVGQKDLPSWRVELKNINSFRFIVSAIEYEIARQTDALEKGKKLHQETRGWNEDKKETFLQRSKEEANDYRYFPDPDLPGLINGKENVNKLRSQQEELPEQKEEKFAAWGMFGSSAKTIATTTVKTRIFEEAISHIESADRGKFGDFLANRNFDAKTQGVAKQLVNQFYQQKSLKSEQIEDAGNLKTVAQEVISENGKSVSDYKSGKINAIGVLIGQAMKKTQGKANPVKLRAIFEQLLS